jgi:hypothetical protein
MARVLIGWELGAGRGHIERIRQITARLLDEGHEVAVALQQVDALGLKRDPRLTLYQSPLWPRLLINAGQDLSRPVATMGDILARLGLDRPGCLAALIAGWEGIFAAFHPDVMIADYAPALLAAARGRLPSLAIGDVFTVPPADALEFPNLAGLDPAYDECAMLDTADADLVSTGRETLAGLPGLFAADRYLIASFAELDPYAGTGRTYCAPGVMPPLADRTGGQGEEIFVYGFNRIDAAHPLWAGLAKAGRPVRVHMAEALPAHIAMMQRHNFHYVAKPLGFPEIAARSKLVVSYGSHGFACASLIAGLPHLVLAYDLEKRLTGSALAQHGYAAALDLFALDANSLAVEIVSLADNAAMAARLRTAAPDFRARMATSLADEVVRAISELLALGSPHGAPPPSPASKA